MRTRGCNGLTYTLDYTTAKDKSDEEVIQDGEWNPQQLLCVCVSVCLEYKANQIKNLRYPKLSSMMVVDENIK